jgi:hypothetical protein
VAKEKAGKKHAKTSGETKQRPSRGRVVDFVPPAGGEPITAIITGLVEESEDHVHLHLFPAPGRYTADLDVAAIPHSDEGKPGTWDWPERV